MNRMQSRSILHSFAWVAAGAILVSHAAFANQEIRVRPFGETEAGEAIDLYTLVNAEGAQAEITNYGGILVSLMMPDQEGEFDDIVLGFDTLDEYLQGHPHFGATVGRYANRIANAEFTLDGETYTLTANDGDNHIHGGEQGFDKVVWRAQAYTTANGPALRLYYVSEDGEEGYPGALDVMVTYTLTNDNELRADFHAETDEPTICNLTHHSYFNLAGEGDILDHVVMMPAEHFTPVNDELIPAGEVQSVEDTPFDFTEPTPIGARIDEENEQLEQGGGYDHNWVYDKEDGELTLMARVTEPESGRVMEVLSTKPGMQFYTGNFLDGSLTGKDGWVYEQRHGFCMEPHYFPDTPNQPDFPSAVLRPDETYDHTIVYRFSVEDE
ncbi:MAG: aldose epimerase family protein [Candidatus Hydrogenedentota bacterium]